MYIEENDLIINKPTPSFYINGRQSEFTRKHEEYKRAISRYHADIEMLCRLLDLKEGQRILEVGGDVGFNLYELAGLQANCIDIDICPGSAEFVGSMADFYDLEIEALRGDTCCLPFMDGCFDAVYSKDTFEHIWDCDCALHEQARVLKKGGRLCVVVGNIASPKLLFELLIRSFVKSKGKSGGLKWLLTKSRVYDNFGIGWHGKGEDMKTIWWWRKKMASIREVEVVTITTTRAYKDPSSILCRILEPFAGSIIIVAVKK